MLPAGAAPPSTDNVEDYCAAQCFYDNIIEAARQPERRLRRRLVRLRRTARAACIRSDDGGQTWTDLGYDQHPDFQVLHLRSEQLEPDRLRIRRRRLGQRESRRPPRRGPAARTSAVDWQPERAGRPAHTTAVTARTGLQIAQFTSIATVPTVPARVWGGTQDNGTLRRSTASASWFDIPSGDGGQVLVDPTADGNCEFGAPGPSCFVYGTYFGISPYRMADGGAFFFNNNGITNGIDLADRSTFYIPLR